MELICGEKLKFIGCQVIYREACKLAAESRLAVDVQFLHKGLHDLHRGDMQLRLQSAVNAVPQDAGYKAVILGYGRCSDGVVGLTARSIPMVIPKAHDCITLLFGSRHAYRTYFDAHPGTYFHSTGWLERKDGEVEGTQGVMAKLGLGRSYENMVAEYGRDEADFIMETLGTGLANYDRYCYIEMGVTDERTFIAESRNQAKERGWHFDLRKGDLSLLRKLFNADWNGDDFLIVPPNHRIIASNDGRILAVSD